MASLQIFAFVVIGVASSLGAEIRDSNSIKYEEPEQQKLPEQLLPSSDATAALPTSESNKNDLKPESIPAGEPSKTALESPAANAERVKKSIISALPLPYASYYPYTAPIAYTAPVATSSVLHAAPLAYAAAAPAVAAPAVAYAATYPAAPAVAYSSVYYPYDDGKYWPGKYDAVTAYAVKPAVVTAHAAAPVVAAAPYVHQYYYRTHPGAAISYHF